MLRLRRLLATTYDYYDYDEHYEHDYYYGDYTYHRHD